MQFFFPKDPYLWKYYGLKRVNPSLLHFWEKCGYSRQRQNVYSVIGKIIVYNGIALLSIQQKNEENENVYLRFSFFRGVRNPLLPFPTTPHLQNLSKKWRCYNVIQNYDLQFMNRLQLLVELMNSSCFVIRIVLTILLLTKQIVRIHRNIFYIKRIF